MDRKQENKIRKAFSEKTAGFGTKRLFRRLQTDEELALCARSCRYAEMKEYAIGAVERVQSEETLLEIALSAPLDWTRNAAVDRLSGNRALLLRLTLPRFDTPKWLSEATAKRAKTHLAAMETELIGSCGTDGKRLCDLLCRREITEAYELALDRIDDPTLLITVAQSAAWQQVIDAALDRIVKLVSSRNDPEPLLRLLRSEKLALQRKAENLLAGLCLKEDPLPLSDAQRETLFQYYKGARDLLFLHGLPLLSDAKLKELYESRRKESDRMIVAACIRPENCTEEIRERLFFANGQDCRACGEAAYKALSDERLVCEYRKAEDERLLFFLYTILSERGVHSEEIDAKMDAVVLAKIDAARTNDGFDGAKLCRIDLQLTPQLRERYGFVEVCDRGETIDGGSWSSKTLRFQGHEYWFYYGQSDGGGAYHSMGERIR